MEIMQIVEGILTLATFAGVMWNAFKWIDKANDIKKEVKDIKEEVKDIKEEQYVHSKAILGLLDGQHQQGLNHRSQDSYNMMIEHLEKKAHDD